MTTTDIVTLDVSPAAVTALDPLDVDSRLPRLWEMNARADVDALASLLRDSLPADDRLAGFSLPESLAAMRDLGLIVGSLRRHGAEPVETVREAEPVLLALGARTGMIPRDTVHHYCTWNPVGARERLFTGEPMERALVASVREPMPALAAAIEAGSRLAELDPRQPDFAQGAQQLAETLLALEDSIDSVTANVTPEFFALTMRPYFVSKVRVGDGSYVGPAAAHVPVPLIDLQLWASDHATSGYRDYWRGVAQYGLPQWRRCYEEFADRPSLVTRTAAALAEVGGSPARSAAAVTSSARELARSLRALVVFRGKHLTIARRTYTPELLPDTGLVAHRGGLALLDELLLLTRRNAALVPTATGTEITGER
ncbi:DUF1864 family protein [Frankia sp. CNm7]|uniref:DUF1864 family protein n=1 Tax=Frankia nepalensis TaxID=1836974 RepID=A0A937RSY5_9ACTN|nr:monodechloroaminopyrrolnitrin synthase PrnB family protein [Frankia nepalensis]MBL7498859.1 DUF1864 family protein [Frankia nepalensis]MBL7513691.1 DUF1864 family protein [Frankia nepalensis]MBL7524156.1 DUF1864 family protein [Frankia nepalensis]MBL7631361.1 DUF1864 family protein [Frankia nepalensis]